MFIISYWMFAALFVRSWTEVILWTVFPIAYATYSAFLLLSLFACEEGPDELRDVPFTVDKLKVSYLSAMTRIYMRCKRCLVLHSFALSKIACRLPGPHYLRYQNQQSHLPPPPVREQEKKPKWIGKSQLKRREKDQDTSVLRMPSSRKWCSC